MLVDHVRQRFGKLAFEPEELKPNVLFTKTRPHHRQMIERILSACGIALTSTCREALRRNQATRTGNNSPNRAVHDFHRMFIQRICICICGSTWTLSALTIWLT